MSFPLSGNLTAACVRRDAISARTKAALAAAKANGSKLGNYTRIVPLPRVTKPCGPPTGGLIFWA